MVIADSCFLIDVMAEHPGALARLQEFVASHEPVWLAAPALEELYYGVGLATKPDRERLRVENLERSLPELAFEIGAARIAGQLRAELAKVGKKPNAKDAQIAAVAMTRQEPVVTSDRAFPAPRGMKLIRY